MPGNSEPRQQHHGEDEALLYPQIPRIEPSDLADVLRNAVHRPVIVDVRETGTTGGFIRGAVNVPKADFDDDATVDALIEKIKDEQEVVFHCQHSQQRGPSAAFRFLERLERKLAENDAKPDVKVLRGGFHEFSEKFGDDETLVDTNPLA